MTIKIYDIQAKVVKIYNHVHPTTFYLKKENLKNGIYLLQIFDNEKVIGIIQFKVDS